MQCRIWFETVRVVLPDTLRSSSLNRPPFFHRARDLVALRAANVHSLRRSFALTGAYFYYLITLRRTRLSVARRRSSQSVAEAD